MRVYLMLYWVALACSLRLDYKLVAVTVIVRHGARYPSRPDTDNLKQLFQTYSVNHFNDLTQNGKLMMSNYGKNLRKMYCCDLFGSQRGQCRINVSKLDVRSTKKQRSVESAKALIKGMFGFNSASSFKPVMNAQKDIIADSQSLTENKKFDEDSSEDEIATNSAKLNLDHNLEISLILQPKQRAFLKPLKASFCPKQREWKEHSKRSYAYDSFLNSSKVQAFLLQLKELLKTTKVSLRQANKVIELCQCQKAQGASYPNICVSQSDFQNYFRLIHKIFKDFYTQEQLSTSMTGLFRRIIHNIDQAIRGFGPTLSIYNGHESTIIGSLMMTEILKPECIINKILGRHTATTASCPLITLPSYASNISFELRRVKDQEYVVRVLYNDQIMRLSGCQLKKQCPLNEFKSWLEKKLVEDVILACRLDSTSQPIREQ